MKCFCCLFLSARLPFVPLFLSQQRRMFFFAIWGAWVWEMAHNGCSFCVSCAFFFFARDLFLSVLARAVVNSLHRHLYCLLFRNMHLLILWLKALDEASVRMHAQEHVFVYFLPTCLKFICLCFKYRFRFFFCGFWFRVVSFSSHFSCLHRAG